MIWLQGPLCKCGIQGGNPETWKPVQSVDVHLSELLSVTKQDHEYFLAIYRVWNVMHIRLENKMSICHNGILSYWDQKGSAC